MKTKTITAKAAGLSFQPIPTLQESASSFAARESKSRRGDGEDEIVLKDFMKIAAFITQNYRSFDLSTFLQASRSLDLDASEIAGLFHVFAEELVRDGRCRKISGCYNAETYHFI